ncbi:hypothetical protein ABID22_003711 [Pontibacter aydingkolensis]|uniref:Uncharacterized protein n=1 Tax=Pontibacter aydingkolensis TaxID=1911536 RepID=A0ABS7CYR7_9BACT|nr:hypothetical protein [Pontibacter aydingkolensis]MBW7469008.1 hypothetical protein [Pontibacter aydingkolensis]
MKRLLFLIPCAFASQVLFAQQASLHDINGKAVQAFDSRYTGIKGTPYFLPGWSKANLVISSKTIFENLDVKYNVIDNNLLYRTDKGEEKVISANQVNSFVLKDSTSAQRFVFKKLENVTGIDPKFAPQFCVMLHEGNSSQLVLMPVKRFIKADFTGAYSAERTSDEIVNEYVYYFINKNKKAEKVKLNKKSLLSVVNDKQNEVKAYIDKQKLDTSTEKGWLKALSYYETL